jgi:hypothetical protein
VAPATAHWRSLLKGKLIFFLNQNKQLYFVFALFFQTKRHVHVLSIWKYVLTLLRKSEELFVEKTQTSSRNDLPKLLDWRSKENCCTLTKFGNN